jgi:molybdopterin-guanine dinucleotide biosynthesis protein A
VESYLLKRSSRKSKRQSETFTAVGLGLLWGAFIILALTIAVMHWAGGRRIFLYAADQSRVSRELDTLASDVLHFLRRIEAAVITACENHKRELLFVAWRVTIRAGETSEIAKEGRLTTTPPLKESVRCEEKLPRRPGWPTVRLRDSNPSI